MQWPATSFAILAYEGIEPIDIGATYGVLSMARRFGRRAQDGERNGFADCPPAEVLMVLGGPGWQAASDDPSILAFIDAFHRRGGTVAGVCTGTMIVGAAGLLAGRPATTKREIVDGETRPLDLLAQRHPGTRAIEARVVDTGTILTGGGVSLGIDMTLHLIQRFFGREIAQETARILEYRNAWKANNAALPDVIEVRDAHHDRSSERSQAC